MHQGLPVLPVIKPILLAEVALGHQELVGPGLPLVGRLVPRVVLVVQVDPALGVVGPVEFQGHQGPVLILLAIVIRIIGSYYSIIQYRS